MGCDIHLFFEKKNKDGKWQKIFIEECLLPDDREYALFGFLAGVRGQEHDPQFAERGLPSDVSVFKNCFNEHGDLHGITYAYLDEILKAPWKKAKLDHCYFKAFCEHVLPRIVCADRNWGDLDARNVRVVMGFDS